MQTQQSPAPQGDTEHGPLNTPRMFRRATGAHAIMLSLVSADIAGFLLTLLLGAILFPIGWWLLRAGLLLLHNSLLLATAVGLILLAFCIGRLFGGGGAD